MGLLNIFKKKENKKETGFFEGLGNLAEHLLEKSKNYSEPKKENSTETKNIIPEVGYKESHIISINGEKYHIVYWIDGKEHCYGCLELNHYVKIPNKEFSKKAIDNYVMNEVLWKKLR
jgi:hypothetical protein